MPAKPPEIPDPHGTGAPRRIKVAVRDHDSDPWRLVDALEFRHPWPGHPEPRVYIRLERGDQSRN